MNTSPPAPAPATPEPMVNVAGPGQPLEPFKYEDTSGKPSGSEAFDKMFSGEDQEKTDPAPEPAQPAAATPDESALKNGRHRVDDGLPGDPKPEPAKEPAKAAPVEPTTARELREAYQKTKEAVAAREKELAELRTQLTAKPKEEQNGEAETYQTKIKELEEQLNERETALKYADYSLSKEFKETYKVPLDEAFKAATTYVSELNVVQADGTKRQATIGDLGPLLRMRAGEAWEAAEEIFGTRASSIMQHRDRILELSQKSQNALEEFRTKGAERMKQTEQQMLQQEQQQAEQRLKTFEGHIASRQTTHKALYGQDEADPDGNRLLSEGQKLTRIAFLGDPNMDPAELVRIQAEVAARASAFGRMVHRSRNLETKLAELTKKLEAFEKSSPGKGSRDGEPSDQQDNIPSWKKAFDAIPANRY